jgi:hypothetical protein
LLQRLGGSNRRLDIVAQHQHARGLILGRLDADRVDNLASAAFLGIKADFRHPPEWKDDIVLRFGVNVPAQGKRFKLGFDRYLALGIYQPSEYKFEKPLPIVSYFE